MRRLALLAAPALLAALIAAEAPAVTITIVNKNAAGEGLNDPTPATPVAGNPGTTIGQQRLNVLTEAARIWGQTLPGNVEIRVDASFVPLSCTANSGSIGSTRPLYVYSDFGGAPQPGIWYVVAEANQLAGEDLLYLDNAGGESHMLTRFNSDLGRPDCLEGSGFYYGFDASTPRGSVNLLTVTLHEFAHGLGFISIADPSTGEFCCGTPGTPGAEIRPDIFDVFVYDTTKAKSWNEMATDGERKTSAVNTGHLVWNGPAANAAGAAYLGDSNTFPKPGMNANGQMLLYAPNPVNPGSSVSHWSTSPVPHLLMEPFANPRLPIGVDITAALFADIGWFGTCPAIGLSPASLPAGHVGVSYGPVKLTPTSGTPPFTFGVSGLPPGLAVTSPLTGPDLSIGGTPTGLFSGVVTVGGNDAIACPFSQELPLTITGPPPTADFTFFSATPKAGQQVLFTDTSTGAPTSWSWDFGDGATSAVQNPFHTFSKGRYEVSLTASNANGSSTRTRTVDVAWPSAAPCVPDTYTMCLVNGRYRVTSRWRNQYAGGAEARLSKAALTDATGAFWLADADIYEYLIRINTATDNGKAWISIPTFTDVEFWIAVFDVVAGQYKEYHSPPGNRTLIYDPFTFVYP